MLQTTATKKAVRKIIITQVSSNIYLITTKMSIILLSILVLI